MSTSTEAGKLKVLAALKNPSEALLGLLAGHETYQLPPEELNTSLVAQQGYNIILLENGMKALPALRAADPRAEIILFGEGDDDAVEAIAKGASAYFKTPPDPGLLAETMESIKEVFTVRRETAHLEKLLQAQYTFAGVVAKNPLMLDIFTYMRRIAPYYRTVIITGETGTGKEVLARALHSLSPRAESPFVACNCGAFVEGLIESELFGHRKGAFTGAIADRVGLFEAAGDGTLFLDEIGLLPLSFQPHLLRVLQDGEFRRVGSSQPSKARCRVIAATNKDPAAEVKAGTLREDLFYRLTSLAIYLPPLRARKDDIPLLCRHFLERFNKRTGKNVYGVSRSAQSAMISYNWPGNVRELESVIEQAAILTTGSFIDVSVLPPALREVPKRSSHFHPESLDCMVRNHLKTVLAHCGGNRTQAAKILGISRRALQRKLEKSMKI
jgi:two-component system response regulator AtoC